MKIELDFYLVNIDFLGLLIDRLATAIVLINDDLLLYVSHLPRGIILDEINELLQLNQSM
ncbi:MAG: hypothetical protein ACRC2R_23705 [Xenococcaceae cyanobacterium]